MNCPKCNTQCPDTERFCPVCGETFSNGAAAPTAQPAPVPRTPEPVYAPEPEYYEEPAEANFLGTQYLRKHEAKVDTIWFFAIWILAVFGVAFVFNLEPQFSELPWIVGLIPGAIVGAAIAFMVNGFRAVTRGFWAGAVALWDAVTSGCFATIVAWIVLGLAYWVFAFGAWMFCCYWLGIIKGFYPLLSNIATMRDPVAETLDEFYALEEKRSRRKKIFIAIQCVLLGLFIVAVVLTLTNII